MTRSPGILAAMATLALAVGGASIGSACSVPVFRYALELWPPDNFPLVVFHRGELAEEDLALVERLRSMTVADEINLRVVTADVEQDLTPELAALRDSAEIDPDALERPLLVLQTPARLGPPSTVLTLELTEGHVEQLVGSPARGEVVRRILEGDSVVWVLLEGGDADRDDQAFQTLTAELMRLEAALELPEPSAADLISGEAEPLKLAFSSLRLGRDDPDERAFVAMLLNVEPDLQDDEFDGEPMVFPIFGRGRALYALVGPGIVPATIEEAARYLTGACQCTVKAENPGADLLMAVDWDRMVTPTISHDAAPPPLSGLASFADAADETPEPAATAAAAVGPAEEDVFTSATPEQAEEVAGLPGRGVAFPAAAPVQSEGEAGVGPGLSALLVVGVVGIAVVLAGFVLTRRDG